MTDELTLSVNGAAVSLPAQPGELLLDVLRDRLGLLGTKRGCSRGECGACTVLVGGRPVMSCITLAAEAADVETIEGLQDEALTLRQAFADEGAFQCGFCTPGQIVRGIALLRAGVPADDLELRRAISGNFVVAPATLASPRLCSGPQSGITDDDRRNQSPKHRVGAADGRFAAICAGHRAAGHAVRPRCAQHYPARPHPRHRHQRCGTHARRRVRAERR